MRTIIARLLAWLFLFVILIEMNSSVYSMFYAPTFDEVTGTLVPGLFSSKVLLLGVCFISFLAAGYVLSWIMRGAAGSVPFAMALGCVWVAADLALSFPWYQLYPSHPDVSDHVIAFVGAACAPMSAALGATFFRVFHKRQPLATAT